MKSVSPYGRSRLPFQRLNLRARPLAKKGGEELELDILVLHVDAGLGNPQSNKEEESNV
jgi:hypothetical protein